MMPNSEEGPDDGWSKVGFSISPKFIFAAALIIGVVLGLGWFGGALVPNSSNGCNSTGPTSSNGFTAHDATCANLGVVVTYPNQHFADPSLIAKGERPSCLMFCNGVSYTQSG